MRRPVPRNYLHAAGGLLACADAGRRPPKYEMTSTFWTKMAPSFFSLFGRGVFDFFSLFCSSLSENLYINNLGAFSATHVYVLLCAQHFFGLLRRKQLRTPRKNAPTRNHLPRPIARPGCHLSFFIAEKNSCARKSATPACRERRGVQKYAARSRTAFFFRRSVISANEQTEQLAT